MRRGCWRGCRGPGSVQNRIRDAGRLPEEGNTSGALKELERAQQEFKKARDRPGLEAVLGLAEQIGATLGGGAATSKLERIVYAATQNLLELDKRSAGGLTGVVTNIPPRNALDAVGGGARAAIEQGLMAGEDVLLVIRGTGTTAIACTDRRAFIFKKGLLAGATFGHKLASFAYETIVGVELHSGAMTGAIVIHVPGAGWVSTSYWSNEKSDPHKAYNAIPIARPYADAQAGVGTLRALISEHSSARHPHVQITPAATPRRSPRLLRQGSLTSSTSSESSPNSATQGSLPRTSSTRRRPSSSLACDDGRYLVLRRPRRSDRSGLPGGQRPWPGSEPGTSRVRSDA
jgi:hypothetical protein